MVKRKKLLGMCVILGAILSMTGCNSESDNNTQATANPDKAESNGETGTETSEKVVYDDLGGMTVKIGDWYSEENPTLDNTYAEDTEAYRQGIFEQYNFTVERKNLCAWVDMPEKFVTEVMSGNPSADIWYLYQDTINEPLKNHLFYDLSKVKTVDFSEEKWNKQVKDIMTYEGGIYGMSTEMEPRAGIFYNKKIFEEAGIDPEEPYNLQAKGEWTWDKFEEYCSKLTKDVDNDGVTDVYAMASFSKDYFKLLAASNGALFVGKDENGQYYNGMDSTEFIEACNWGVDLINKGYIMPDPEGASWDWFITAFRDGECAMQAAEVYTVSTFADSMTDNFGFVMFPAGPKGDMATVPLDNVIVVPSCFDDEYVNKIMFAYNLYTETTPGYTIEEAWKQNYYSLFDDTRAVDETLEMMREDKHRVIDYKSMIPGTDYGKHFTYDVYALAKTPAEKIEEVRPAWEQFIKDANEKR